MSEIKKVDHTSADQGEEQLHLTHSAGGIQNGAVPLGKWLGGFL